MENNKLNILWTNADPITAKLMVLMYASNAVKREWWDQVNIIIWGATARLIADNTDIQDMISEAQQAGVTFVACQACAEKLGATSILEGLNIKIKYMGEDLTEILKTNEKLLTI